LITDLKEILKDQFEIEAKKRRGGRKPFGGRNLLNYEWERFMLQIEIWDVEIRYEG